MCNIYIYRCVCVCVCVGVCVCVNGQQIIIETNFTKFKMTSFFTIFKWSLSNSPIAGWSLI